MPYESQVILKVTRKKSAEIDKKALGKGTIKWSSVSKQILLPVICTTHSLWRKNTSTRKERSGVEHSWKLRNRPK